MSEQGKKPTHTSTAPPAGRRLRFDVPHTRAVKPPHFPAGKEPRQGR